MGLGAAWVNIAEFYPKELRGPPNGVGAGHTREMTAEPPYCKWMCLVCGFIYDEAAGLPEEGLPAGMRWAAVPPNWTCPECGARKEDFEMQKI